MLQSEVILDRYKAREQEADALGRIIKVRRLRPSEQAKVAGMTADLSGSDEMITPDGRKLSVPHRLPLTVAAAVCEINGVHIPFPKTRQELDAIFDQLDAEGLSAASKALALLEGEVVSSPVDEAKN